MIAGYTLASRTFDAVVFGYYDNGKLLYAGRTRSGFTPASRDQLFKRFAALQRNGARSPTCQMPGVGVGVKG